MSDETIDPRRLVFPQLAGLYRSLSPFSYAFMRFAAGAVLVPHGWVKVFSQGATAGAAAIARHGLPFPELLSVLTAYTELIGAACLAIGLLTRIAAVAVWLEMTVVILVFNWPAGYFWTDKGYEYALLWWLLAIAVFFRGGGRYSIDRLIGKEF